MTGADNHAEANVEGRCEQGSQDAAQRPRQRANEEQSGARPATSETPPSLVTWVDASLQRTGWQHLDELSLQDPRCRSVGWIVEEDRQQLLLVPHLTLPDDDGQEGYGVMAIPKASIIDRRELLSKPPAKQPKDGD